MTSLLYRLNTGNVLRNKQVCVVDVWPERKLRKELCRRLLQAAQLSTQEWNENSCPMQKLRSWGFVRLPSLHSMRRERAKTAAYPQAEKSKENF